MEHHTSGQIEVITAGERATSFFRMPSGNGYGHGAAAATVAAASGKAEAS
jgi:hypothetical protein